MKPRQGISLCYLLVLGCCLFLAISGLLLLVNLLLLTDADFGLFYGFDQSTDELLNSWTANSGIKGNRQSAKTRQDSDSSSCAVPRMASQQAAIERLIACLLLDQQTRFEPFNRSRLVNFTGTTECGMRPQPSLLTSVFNSKQLAKSWTSVDQFLTFISNGTFQKDKTFNQSWTDSHRLEKLRAYNRYLMNTRTMQSLHLTLLNNGLIPTSQSSIEAFFNSTIYRLWFLFYGRRKSQQRRSFHNSCGFEHVFVGELRGLKVIGFHNWLQMLVQEETASLHYTGQRGVQRQPSLVARVCFNWFNRRKDFSTIMLGVEPEFELALYTATHLLKPNGASRLKLDAKRGWHLEVQNYQNDFTNQNLHAAFVIATGV